MYTFQFKRKKSFSQWEITDFMGKKRHVIFHMDVPAERRDAKRVLNARKQGKGTPPLKAAPVTRPATLWDFVIPHKVRVPSPRYLLRFPRHVVAPTETGRAKLSPLECLLYWELPRFEGFFEDLFGPADFAFWDAQEVELGKKGLLRSIPCMRDMFAYECLRIHLGAETYAQFYRILSILGTAAVIPLLASPKLVPTEQDFSDFYHVTPLDAFQEFFWGLVRALHASKAISAKVMIWDCQFLHSNASDYKDELTGTYSDRDAGLGRHANKFLGVGYQVSTLYLYCGQVVVPVFCVLFPANARDPQIFGETLRYYYSHGWPIPLLVLADRGAHSIANERLLAARGTIGMLNVPKTVTKQHVVELDADHRFNRDFVPAAWTDAGIRDLMALRTVIERQFSHNTLVYHARRANVREIAEVAKHRYMVLILDILKTRACLSLGRGDLLGRSTAFSRMRGSMSALEWVLLLVELGIKPLAPFLPPTTDINRLRMLVEQGQKYMDESQKSSK